MFLIPFLLGFTFAPVSYDNESLYRDLCEHAPYQVGDPITEVQGHALSHLATPENPEENVVAATQVNAACEIFAWSAICRHAPVTEGHVYSKVEKHAMRIVDGWHLSVEEINQRCR